MRRLRTRTIHNRFGRRGSEDEDARLGIWHFHLRLSGPVGVHEADTARSFASRSRGATTLRAVLGFMPILSTTPQACPNPCLSFSFVVALILVARIKATVHTIPIQGFAHVLVEGSLCLLGVHKDHLVLWAVLERL